MLPKTNQYQECGEIFDSEHELNKHINQEHVGNA
jgi:hypothetical protein